MSDLTETRKQQIQENLSHLLKDYRFKHKLSSKEMAAKLNYTSARYSKIENEVYQWDRMINSVDLFFMLSEQLGTDPSTLFSSLIGDAPIISGKKQIWQDKLLEFFKRIDIHIREQFVNQVAMEHSKEAKDVLESILKLYVAVRSKKVPKSVLDSLTEVSEYLAGMTNA